MPPKYELLIANNISYFWIHENIFKYRACTPAYKKLVFCLLFYCNTYLVAYKYYLVISIFSIIGKYNRMNTPNSCFGFNQIIIFDNIVVIRTIII
jgi:hypothetical protein